MKRIAFFMIAMVVVLMSACNSKSPEEQVTEFLTATYDSIFGDYNKHSQDMEWLSTKDFETPEFLSESYLSLYQACLDKQEANDDGMGCFDYDHWVMGQDFENLSMELGEITVQAKDKAEANIQIVENGENMNRDSRAVHLMLVKEADGWKIDDFDNEKQIMEEYLAD